MDNTAAQPLRLFTALWPDAAPTAAIAAWQAAWQWPTQASPTRPERLHMTLHFLGNVAGNRVAGLVEGLRVPFDAFSLELGAGEIWPNGVAVVLPREQPAALARLHSPLSSGRSRAATPTARR
jgi:RNA 2',3'-cyclic 3'-phosphodiesterase